MKKAKKILSMLICTSVMLGATACSNAAKPTQTSDTKQDSSSNVKKPTEIKVMVDGFGAITDATGLSQFTDEFKKQTGITLTAIVPNHNEYIQKVRLSFASGDIPDVVGLGATDLVDFANSGALYDVSGLVSKSQVFQDIFKDAASKSAFDAIKVDDKYYGCTLAKGSGVVTYIRKDLLNKAGLKVPTTNDEFMNALRAFSKMKTDDGKPIIAYTAPGLDPQACSYLPEFYVKTTGSFEKQDGKWVDGFTTPAMVETLTNLQSAYKEGLLDKEIVTNKTSTCRDKWNAGQVGVFSYWAGKWAMPLDDKVKSTVQGGEVIAMPALNGMKYYRGQANSYAITSKCANPEGVFKYFMEYIEDGKDGTMLMSHGVKDVHYKMDASGKCQPLPTLNDPATPFTNAVVEIGLNVQPNYKDPFDIDARVTQSNKILSDNEKNSPLAPASDSYSKYGGTIQTLKSQIVSKIVIDGSSITDGINQYKSQTDSQVAQILKDFNKTK